MPSPKKKSPASKKPGATKPGAKKPAAKKAATKSHRAKAAPTTSSTPSKKKSPSRAGSLGLGAAKGGAEASGPDRVPATGAALAKQHERALKFAIDAARLLTDDKCREVVVLDVRGRSQVTDFTVVATGTSDRQMKAAGEHVDKMGEKQGMRLYRHNLREANPTWVILDFVDVVVHVFEPESRLYYDIEMLWGDAPRVAWERAGDLKAKRDEEDAMETPVSRNRAGLRRGDVL